MTYIALVLAVAALVAVYLLGAEVRQLRADLDDTQTLLSSAVEAVADQNELVELADVQRRRLTALWNSGHHCVFEGERAVRL